MNLFNNNIAFGPVPSRRLGKSLGINNIPPKTCTYCCVYCQLGKTSHLQCTRQPFYTLQEIHAAVKPKIQGAIEKKEVIDYLTFVADGEPTLDSNLGKEITQLKTLGIKIAVITNASLIRDKEVQHDLLNADWVSLKIDTVDQKIWHHINRPASSIKLKDIVQGISEFSESFSGDLITETMLLQNINDTDELVTKTAEFISQISPKKSYLSIPIRPPAETGIKPPSESQLNNAFHIFGEHGIETEYLISNEGNTFAQTGDPKEDLLSIMSVHPMREDAVKEFLSHANAHWNLIENLLNQQKIIQTEYNGITFFMRKLPNNIQTIKKKVIEYDETKNN